jgi:hypothetical protein
MDAVPIEPYIASKTVPGGSNLALEFSNPFIVMRSAVDSMYIPDWVKSSIFAQAMLPP